MSNVWKATSADGEQSHEFLSRDGIDVAELVWKLGNDLPITIVDKTDGDRYVGRIVEVDDEDSSVRLKVEFVETEQFVPAFHGPPDPRIAERATVVKLEQIAADADVKAAEHVASGHHQDASYWLGFAAGLRRATRVVEARG